MQATITGTIKVVEYRRVSTDRQAEMGEGLEFQGKSNEEYCDRNGFEIVETFVDDVSGASFSRPAYTRLIAFVKANPDIKGLVVDRQDRFSRGAWHEAGQELEELQRMGLFIAFSSENNMLTSTEHLATRMDLGFKALFASYENARRSENTIRGMKERVRGGHWTHKAPFGYELVPCDSPVLPEEFRCCGRGKKLAPTAKGAIVTEAAKRLDRGETSAQVRDWLWRQHRKDFAYGHILRFLTNPAYAGDVVHGRRGRGKYVARVKRDDVVTVENAHPALIDRGVFNRLRARGRKPATPARLSPTPYDGLVACACGSRARRSSGSKAPSGGRY